MAEFWVEDGLGVPMNISKFILIAMLVPANTLAASPEATELVSRLYRDYAWEAVIRPSSETYKWVELMNESGVTLRNYFTGRLADLIVKDRQCNERTREICNLDFLPIWASQDPGAADLEVIKTNDPSVVRVKFVYPGDHSVIKLTYVLSNTNVGWRIDDIRGEFGSLRKILEGK